MRVVNGTPVEDLAGSGLITRQRIVIPVWVTALGLAGTAATHRAGWILTWLVRAWIVTVPAAAVLTAWLTRGRLAAVVVLLLIVAVLTGWRLRGPASFSTTVTQRLRGWARWNIRYARAWHAGMDGVGLTRTTPARVVYTPKVTRIRSTRWVDVLDWRLLHGQTPAEIAAAAEGLRHVFAAHRCAVTETAPGRVRLTFYTRDPLRDLVSLIDPDPVPDPEALRVGLVEDGTEFRLRLLGTHLLVAGATGAGKGSVLWAIVRALAPAIHAGTVRVTGIDPKGGMELFPGRRLFAQYADEDAEEMAAAIEAVCDRMIARKAKLKAAGLQKFRATPEEPFEVLLIDELAFLTAYATKDIKMRVATALALILSQGRAVGYSVVGLLQDPRKDVVAFRNLFPTRIALRLAEDSEVDLVLGDGAMDRGARCHEIPAGLPGVAYARTDGVPEPVRLRFPYVTTDDVREMADRWPEPTLDATPQARVVDLGDARIPLQRNDSHESTTDRSAGQES